MNDNNENNPLNPINTLNESEAQIMNENNKNNSENPIGNNMATETDSTPISHQSPVEPAMSYEATQATVTQSPVEPAMSCETTQAPVTQSPVEPAMSYEATQTAAAQNPAQAALAQPTQGATYNQQSETPPKKRGGFKKVVAVCAVAAVGFFALGAGVTLGVGVINGGFGSSSELDNFPTETAPSTDAEVESAFSETSPAMEAATDGTVANVVEEVSNSVVSINIESLEKDAFNRPVTSSGAGSGVIFSEDAEKIYVATNNHVISGADHVTISIDDDNKAPAEYVGSDAMSDLAVISVNKTDLTTAGMDNYTIAKVGDSDLLRVGDPVIAIGNALGEGKSATFGIVSAVNKEINIEGITLNTIQTDAAINAGNSGGALVNLQGEVIGINTAKLASAGVEGMGYSIPSNDAKTIITQLKATGKVARPFLGVQPVTITEEIKEMYGFPSTGAYVSKVTPGTAAAQAGIVEGDIIVGYNDQKITTAEELSDAVAATEIGDTVDIYVYKDGSTPTVLEATITDMNDLLSFNN